MISYNVATCQTVCFVLRKRKKKTVEDYPRGRIRLDAYHQIADEEKQKIFSLKLALRK
jgi:hypothetical protein